MIKKIAWETFKKTGNIDTFMELKQIEGIEEHSLESLKQELQDDSFNGNIILDNSNRNNRLNDNE